MNDLLSRWARRLLPLLFWLLVWQAASVIIGREVFLPSPAQVAVRVFQLAGTTALWQSIGYTTLRILAGYALGVLSGALLAALSVRFRAVEFLLSPLMLTVKTVPVASFIILALICFSAQRLSLLISFLMVLPILYQNTRSGILTADRQLDEMAWGFRLPPWRKLWHVTFPQVLPSLSAGCSVAIGLAWKSGVAAEVIGIPRGSVGSYLQQAKVYLETTDLLAWTVVIVLASLLCEKAVRALLRALGRRSERM